MRTLFLLASAIFLLGLLERLPRAHAQNFFGIFTGNSKTVGDSLRLIQPSTQTDLLFRGVSWRLASRRSAPYFGVRYGGYFRRYPRWGMEFNYTHNKAVLNVDESVPVTGALDGQPVNGALPINTRIQQLEILNGENIFGVNLLYRVTGRATPAFPRGRLQLFTGAGPAFFWLHNSNRINNQNNRPDYQASGVGWQTLLGLDYGLDRHFSLILEGKYTAGTARLGTASDAIVETPLRSWHVTIGVLYKL